MIFEIYGGLTAQGWLPEEDWPPEICLLKTPACADGTEINTEASQD